MMMCAVATVLTTLAFATQTDTTLSVRPGTRLDVNNFGGEIAVQVWDKNAVRVEATHSIRVQRSIQGSVTVDGARGRLEASSVNEGVNVSDVVGDVSVEAVNGDVQLRSIVSALVEAATVNGDVTYVGVVRDGGRYRFASHNGDLI